MALLWLIVEVLSINNKIGLLGHMIGKVKCSVAVGRSLTMATFLHFPLSFLSPHVYAFLKHIASIIWQISRLNSEYKAVQ